MAWRFAGKGQALEDLRQVAAIGLIKAVDRFDPSRGSDFLAFAVPTIAGEIRHHFRDSAWMLHVSRRRKESRSAVLGAMEELTQRFGRRPDTAEIAEYLGVPAESVADGIGVGNAYQADSLDGHGDGDTGPGGSLPLAERLGANDPALDDVEHGCALYPALALLGERERSILALRFFGNMTQFEIGQRLGISQMHVSRLLARSLAFLRQRCDVSGA